jgi:hypothetical protein
MTHMRITNLATVFMPAYASSFLNVPIPVAPEVISSLTHSGLLEVLSQVLSSPQVLFWRICPFGKTSCRSLAHVG